MSDQVDKLLREIEELRNALKGRTVSCDFCNRTSKHADSDDIRMLLETYRHCRKFAHAGEVGTNAVTLIAALEELLQRRAADKQDA